MRRPTRVLGHPIRFGQSVATFGRKRGVKSYFSYTRDAFFGLLQRATVTPIIRTIFFSSYTHTHTRARRVYVSMVTINTFAYVQSYNEFVVVTVYTEYRVIIRNLSRSFESLNSFTMPPVLITFTKRTFPGKRIYYVNVDYGANAPKLLDRAVR